MFTELGRSWRRNWGWVVLGFFAAWIISVEIKRDKTPPQVHRIEFRDASCFVTRKGISCLGKYDFT